MGLGARHSFVESFLSPFRDQADVIIEIGAGGAVYRPLFSLDQYYATDVPNSHYQSKGDIDVFASADTLPFNANVADLIFCQAALDYMPNRRKVLSEAYRVLKPGGALLIFTYNQRTLRRIDAACRQSGERHYGIYSLQELLSELQSAGFHAQKKLRDYPITSAAPGIADWGKLLLSLTTPTKRLLNYLSIWRIAAATKPLGDTKCIT